MSEPRTPAEGAPSADAVKEHVTKYGKETNLGTANAEPDPATAEDPPSDLPAGDTKRQNEGSEGATDAGVGGSV